MAVTTTGAIHAHFMARIQALVPEFPDPILGRGFTFRGKAGRPLRPWRPTAADDDMFRRFEIARGRREDLGINDPTEQLVAVPFSIRVAYPANPARPTLFGLQRHEFENLIETDATQIRDELESPSGLESDAHQANLDLVIEELAAPDEEFWFQDITCVAIFYTRKRA